MNERLKVPYPVIVEGKYDKIKLASLIEAVIVPTDGFGVFSSAEKLALIRRLAGGGKIIVLTDPDGAGAVIRGHIRSALPAGSVIDLYVPRVEGRERRKRAPSKSGSLGVEGIDAQYLRVLFEPFSVDGAAVRQTGGITKADFYEYSLTGCEGAAERRDLFAQSLRLPPGMTPNALLAAVNAVCTREEFEKAAREASGEG